MDAVILSSGPYHPTKFLYRYIGAYKIAHACRAYGYDVQVIDFVNFMTEEQVYAHAKRFIDGNTVILALSTTFLFQKTYSGGAAKDTGSLWPAHIVAAVTRLKREHPRLMIVLGGYNSTIAEGHDIVDAVVLNYGEDIFLELLDHRQLGMQEPEYQIVKSINERNESRKVYSKAREKRHDITTDNHIFAPQDCILPGETLPLEVSRGCIFTCKFCHHLLLGRGKLDYLRSFECIRAELEHNYAHWGVTNYYVICDTFNDTLEKMQRWHTMVTTLPFKIKFTCYLRADLLERFPDEPYILQESGLHSAFHGIESLGQQASYTIGKAWSGKKAREYIPRLYHDIWGDKINQHTGFIIGLPDDTREMIMDTIDWYRVNDLYGIVIEPLTLSKHKHVLASFSEFERHHEKYGYTFKDDDLNNWILPYWDRSQVLDFHGQTIRPILDPINAWYTQWQLMALESIGISQTYPLIADKSWQHTQNFHTVKTTILAAAERFLDRYHTALRGL